MKWDFNHIDPRTGLPKMVDNRKSEIQLMNRLPWRSEWIYLLQNRVGLNTVGNQRYKKKVWYDCHDHTVSSDESKNDAVNIHNYILPHCGRPAGWISASLINERWLFKKLHESKIDAKPDSVIFCWTDDNKYPYIGTVLKNGTVKVNVSEERHQSTLYLSFDSITQWDYVNNVFPNKHKSRKEENISESLNTDNIPQFLYHATPACYLASIKKYGLGGKIPKHRWWDYHGTEYEHLDKGVFLANDDIVAYDFVYCSEEFEEFADDYEEKYDTELKIIVFKVNTSDLDLTKLSIDNNLNDEENPTYFYSDIIPYDLLEKVDTSDYD